MTESYESVPLLLFFTFTATTTGFGEMPAEFSEPQRLWATICVYRGGCLALRHRLHSIRLVQHPELVTAVSERRFARQVRAITPFVVICGFGDTGSLLARGLSDNYRKAAVIDINEEASRR